MSAYILYDKKTGDIKSMGTCMLTDLKKQKRAGCCRLVGTADPKTQRVDITQTPPVIVDIENPKRPAPEPTDEEYHAAAKNVTRGEYEALLARVDALEKLSVSKP